MDFGWLGSVAADAILGRAQWLRRQPPLAPDRRPHRPAPVCFRSCALCSGVRRPRHAPPGGQRRPRSRETGEALKEQLRLRLAEPSACSTGPVSAPRPWARAGPRGRHRRGGESVLARGRRSARQGQAAPAPQARRQRRGQRQAQRQRGRLLASARRTVADRQHARCAGRLRACGRSRARRSRDCRCCSACSACAPASSMPPRPPSAARSGSAAAPKVAPRAIAARTMLGDVHAARAGAGRGARRLPGRPARGAGAAGKRRRQQPPCSATCPSPATASATCCWPRATSTARLTSFRSGLEIAEVLAERDPRNAGWQHDLSVSHDRVGEMLQRHGRPRRRARQPPQRPRHRRAAGRRSRIGSTGSGTCRRATSGSATSCWRRARRTRRSITTGAGWRSRRPPSCAIPATCNGSATWPRAITRSARSRWRAQLGEARDLLEKGRAIIARLERIASYQAQWRSDLSRFDEALRTLGWPAEPVAAMPCSASSRLPRCSLISPRAGLDRQVGIGAPFGPRAVVDRGVGPAEHGQRQRDDAGGDARSAGGDHRLARIDARPRRRSARSSAAGFSVPSALSSVANGTLREPGMWPERRPWRGSATLPSKRRGGPGIDDLRGLAADQALHVGDVAHQLGMEARREMALGCAAAARRPRAAGPPPSISSGRR